MSDAAGNGLATVNKYYEDYSCRARELKQQGRKILGYLCALVPVEMLTAAGFIPSNFRKPLEEAKETGKTPTEMVFERVETMIYPVGRFGEKP